MNFLYQITVDDYLEVVRRSREAGVLVGESMEAIFIDYMNEKQKNPICGTDLTKNEILGELTQKNDKILKIDTDSQGHQSYTVIEKKPNIEE